MNTRDSHTIRAVVTKPDSREVGNAISRDEVSGITDFIKQLLFYHVRVDAPARIRDVW